MHTQRIFDTEQKIRLYDGYQGSDIWSQPKNDSTYYDYEIDKQCSVPGRDKEEVMKELGLI
jgi:hypothetical protein